MSEASYLRGTAQHLRGRAETARQEPVRAQLLALADYYEGMAEDFEFPSPLGTEARIAPAR
ncbi:MAG TPA: hypothetical protein VN668_14985 [Stellaceae bacterium]|nr:hypothetical protein [Stellaceae bacterium]